MSYEDISVSVLHVSIHLKFTQCCVHVHGYMYKYNELLCINKFAFFKNSRKVFEMSLSKGLNMLMQDINFTAQNNVDIPHENHSGPLLIHFNLCIKAQVFTVL